MTEATSPGPYGALHLGRGDIGQAIKAMKDGKRVARAGWNGVGLFVFMQVPAEINVKEIVPKMQSLPQSVKDEFQKRFEMLYADGKTPEDDSVHLSIKYSNQMAIVDKQNNINGWAPSTSDALATDWVILD